MSENTCGPALPAMVDGARHTVSPDGQETPFPCPGAPDAYTYEGAPPQVPECGEKGELSVKRVRRSHEAEGKARMQCQHKKVVIDG